MQKVLFHLLIFILSKLSLRAVHNIGYYIGNLYFSLNKRNYDLLKKNLLSSNIFSEKDIEKEVKKNIGELGKSIFESLFIWGSSQESILKYVKKVNGLDCIKKAEKKGKGIIFLTPHLGCFEITSIFYGSTNPITVMYRKARKVWMSELMIKGRKKGQVDLAAADIRGIKKLLFTLKKGQAVGILPDQVADKGQGESASFFGRPAYTMVLVNKLINKTNASVIMAYGERLEHGGGFIIHAEEINKKNISTPADLNGHVERIVRKCPSQYFWSYDRFKKVKNQ